MRELDDIIISCAITGSVHTPSMSDHLPVTPSELISEGIAAAEAGASIIHIHVRDPETGEPSGDMELFREVAAGIDAETDAIVQTTTGGGSNQTVEERFAVIDELSPEMASCNMGSINFGLFGLTETTDEFQYDWEQEYLESTRDHVFQNTFSDIEEVLRSMNENETVPELEIYDVGHLHTAKHFLDQGMLEPPLHLQFVMGTLGGISADEHHLVHLVQTAERLFGDRASWSVIGGGRKEFALGSQGAGMGGHARVGMEDNLYLERGELASSNAELVRKMVNLAWDVAGREPASPDDVRDFLQLKGADSVGF